MSEKSNKTKKISTNSKNLLEVLREKNSLNPDYWDVKNELTLGECVLIFYDIEPIPSLSNTIDRYIFSMIFEDKPHEKIDKKSLLEKILSSQEELTKEVLNVELPKKMSLLDFICRMDKYKICNKLIKRWSRGSKNHGELGDFLGLIEDPYSNYPYHCQFAEEAFIDLFNRDNGFIFPTLVKENFGNLLIIWGNQSFLDSKIPFTITEDINENNFYFRWFGFRKINTKSELIEHNESEINEEDCDSKRDSISSAIIKVVRQILYSIFISREKLGLDTNLTDVFSHPLMKEILEAISEHSKDKKDQELDEKDCKEKINYKLPEKNTITYEWISPELNKLKKQRIKTKKFRN